MEKRREIDQNKAQKIASELIEVATNNQATLIEFDDAVYKVRQYYNENAVLKADSKEN